MVRDMVKVQERQFSLYERKYILGILVIFLVILFIL